MIKQPPFFLLNAHELGYRLQPVTDISACVLVLVLWPIIQRIDQVILFTNLLIVSFFYVITRSVFLLARLYNDPCVYGTFIWAMKPNVIYKERDMMAKFADNLALQ